MYQMSFGENNVLYTLISYEINRFHIFEFQYISPLI